MHACTHTHTHHEAVCIKRSWVVGTVPVFIANKDLDIELNGNVFWWREPHLDTV